MPRCEGEPPGSCKLRADPGWLLCKMCRLRRQREAAAPIKLSEIVSEVSVRFRCECGGDKTAPLHEQTLHHRRYLWAKEWNEWSKQRSR